MRTSDSRPSTSRGSSPDGEWIVSVARMLGRAARWARSGADRIVSPGGSRTAAGSKRKSRSEPSLSVLVQRLARHVNEHAADGYATLVNDPAFWMMIERLYVRRPTRAAHARPVPSRRDSAKRAAAPSASEKPRRGEQRSESGSGGSGEVRPVDEASSELAATSGQTAASEAKVEAEAPAQKPVRPTPAEGGEVRPVDEASSELAATSEQTVASEAEAPPQKPVRPTPAEGRNGLDAPKDGDDDADDA